MVEAWEPYVSLSDIMILSFEDMYLGIELFFQLLYIFAYKDYSINKFVTSKVFLK